MRVLRFEEPEGGDVVAVHVVVQAVVARQHAADHLVVLDGEEQLDIRVGEERILRGESRSRSAIRSGGIQCGSWRLRS